MMWHSSDRNGIHLQLHSLYIIIFDNRFYDYLTPPLNSVVRRSNDLLPEKRLNCLKFVTTYCCNVHGQKGSPITAAFAASDRSYHLNIWRLGESCHNVVTTFFLFSKCLICLTHSHNASAVSLIFFCDSEYDQSLVPRSHFLFGQHQERPDICAWRDWNMIMYSCLLRQCRKCFTVFRLKTYGDRAFSIAGPKLWNDLPLEIRKCASVATFKQSLKTFLFKLAYRLWDSFCFKMFLIYIVDNLGYIWIILYIVDIL